ncbi:MAG: transcription-repair coupling factor, partial [Bacillota bacterium]
PLTLLDYCPPSAMVFLDEPGRVKEVVDFHHQEAMEHQVTLLKGGLALLGQERAILDFGALWQRMEKRRTISASLLPKRPSFMRSPYAISAVTKSIPAFFGQVKLFAQEVERWHANHYTVVILTATDERSRRVHHMLSEYGVESVIRPELQSGPLPGEVVITLGSLETGFEWPQARLIVLTDEEVFGKPKKKRRQRGSADGIRISSHRELSVGDLVVHVNHGIGRYLGVTTLEVGGVHRDYLHIKYGGEDKLYVPTDQVGLVQKYVGAGNEEKEPKLHTLGGADWNRVKTRVQESVREMAEDLVKLYAARQATPGYAFAPDTPWQREFEDMFSYEETPDQLQSIAEVKADMELSRPMDRLLCGDVGYGKTEVAIRAAFKAVMDGKQVAVLVPTTILAQQHYNTFRERFGGFPINVALMSRFRSTKENKETALKLMDKKVDVVIGTHRLLAKDIKFADLGLLVIDEEQRFGVAHKEKIKQLKTNVDVLTLSATPIPRTLHMAMIGIRDLSVIETPPEDRFPVQTYVVEWNDEMIKEAILREMDRQGQVFFVHNKVQNIDYIAQQLSELVPEARIAVAHGQMPETKLEQIMLEFLDGEYDILLATTIIESGLDMPNVNTIILNDADKFGLSQLYQLRGRVGRSNRLAYAYFTYRRDKQLSEVAEKRLSAIKEFTELGAGYKIALRDLEIRGVGNLLGPQQHGHVAAVGFELYSQLLEEAIAEFKGSPQAPRVEVTVELNVEAYIPANYISDAAQKIEFYKRINEIKSAQDIDDVEEEMEDRFGDLALPVRNLLAVARIKLLAQAARVTTISQQNGLVALKPHSGFSYHPLQVGPIVREFRGALDYSQGKQQSFTLRGAGLTDAALLAQVEKVLTHLVAIADRV